MLEIKSVVHSYGSESTITYPDWKIEKGQHSMILGGSGSGKTTLLHLIGGLLRPSSGSLLVNDNNLTALTQSGLDRFRGANIGIVFQKPHLISALNVLENLTLAQYLSGQKINKQAALDMLKELDILNLKSRKIHEISQGQSQRVSIARALLNRPVLLLADEPTASLDDINCEKVTKLLKTQAEAAGSTLVVATHDQRVKSQFKNTLTL